MRSWSVVGKYPIYTDGEISHTEITIASTTGGYATYTERVLGDQMAKTDSELVGLAREAHFKREYADRAMAESVQKIEELDQIANKAKVFMATANQEFEAIKHRQEAAEAERDTRFNKLESDMQKKIDDAVVELTTMFAGFSGQFEESKEEASPQESEVENEV